MIKHYPITFRDDYNGRPKIYIMSDDTKFLIMHPFYSFDSDNYGRYYTYYSLDENFDLDNNIEIWLMESGTFCISDCWSEFKKSFLGISNELNIETKLIIDTTIFLVKRIPIEDFKPDSLEEKTSFLDYVNNNAPAKNQNIKGYVKFGNEAFAVIDVKWNTNYLEYDEGRYRESGFENVLSEEYAEYKEGYEECLVINTESNLNYKGMVYSLPDEGVLLFLETKLG